MRSFDPRFNPEWQGKLSSSRFAAVAIQHNKVVLQFQMGQDDGGVDGGVRSGSAAPAASSGQGNVVAAYYIGQTGPSRFCTLHTALGDNSHDPWVLIGNGRPAKGTGYLPVLGRFKFASREAVLYRPRTRRLS